MGRYRPKLEELGVGYKSLQTQKEKIEKEMDPLNTEIKRRMHGKELYEGRNVRIKNVPRPETKPKKRKIRKRFGLDELYSSGALVFNIEKLYALLKANDLNLEEYVRKIDKGVTALFIDLLPPTKLDEYTILRNVDVQNFISELDKLFRTYPKDTEGLKLCLERLGVYDKK